MQNLARHKKIEKILEHDVHMNTEDVRQDLFAALGAIPGATREVTLPPP